MPSDSALQKTNPFETPPSAFDNIFEGKSTFFVEMEETKVITSNSTPHSLSIFDELGTLFGDADSANRLPN